MENIHPQTEIEIIAKYSCLIQSYIYCCGIEPDTKKYFDIIYDAIKAGVEKSGVAKDCTVENANKFIKWLTGRDIPVEKKNIINLKQIKEAAPVEFQRWQDGIKYTHFAVVRDGEIIFNPLEKSYCIEKGHPVSARVFNISQYEIK